MKLCIKQFSVLESMLENEHRTTLSFNRLHPNFPTKSYPKANISYYYTSKIHHGKIQTKKIHLVNSYYT